MSQPEATRAHVIVGGFPPGSPAAHDMDYARLRLLELLHESDVPVTVAGDFTDVAKWLPGSRLLLTYVAGPHPNETENEVLRQWIEDGGRWLALHGTSGGRAAPVGGERWRRKMVKAAHHETLGSFFLNHPPVRRFRVDVADRGNPLTRGLPASFEVMDELYLIELQDPSSCHVLLTTELEKDPSPQGFGFVYDEDTSRLPGGNARALGYVRELGAGGVAYFALGHCHSPTTNGQPFVDESVAADGKTPLLFRGPWETEAFGRLLRNGVEWGMRREGTYS